MSAQDSRMPQFPTLKDVHVLVVGDLMLDRYWQGAADRVSPEAPVPVLNVERIDERAGAAANVALNVVSLGARCTLIGFVGADEAGRALAETLTAAGVHCDLIEVEDWPTIVKLRLVAQRQQLMRADFEDPLPLVGTSERLALLQNRVEKHLPEVQAMILEDYDKGALEEPQPLIHAARAKSVPVIVDPKLKPFEAYRGAACIKPNEKEFLATAGEDADASALCEALDVGGFVVTRGGDGLEVFTADAARHVPARPVDVYDVTGAGDTTAAALGIGLALDWTLYDAARVANVAASVAVSKSGTSPVSGPELALAISARGDGGLLSLDEVKREADLARQAGQRIVFTNGCFDILHAGHVTYLEEAAALGDRLIVAINDDDSVTRLKGPGRPVVGVGGRARVLLGLSCVDWVVSFSTDTPEPLLEALRPDVLVKGGDYDTSEVVGGEFVADYGGEVKVLSLVQDVSTTAIVEKIKGG